MSQITSMADKDRVRQRSASKHRVNAAVADTARRVVAEYLQQGRAADACMADLVRAAREAK